MEPDLDIAFQQKDVATLREFLHAQSYREIKLEGARPWNFVLGDENGREIDVRLIVLDDKGNGIYGPLRRDVSGCIPDGSWQDTRQEGEVYFTGMDGEISFRLSTQRKGFSGRIRLVRQIWD
jgi:hypothetical protein